MLSTSSFSNTHLFLVNMSAPFGHNDDGGGVGLTEGHVGMGQCSGAESPRCVHISSPDSLQLRNPLPYVVTLQQTCG